MTFRKPELIPLLFIICAVALLAGLGVWQVERLQWKNGQLAKITNAQKEAALGTLPQTLEGLEYRNVALTGTFLNDKSFHLIGHIQDEGAGFFIVTPFMLDDDGRIILVNRGFSPAGKEGAPEGIQTVKGIIRPARQKRYFSPDNNPQKNVWFYEDFAAMSHTANINLTPLIVEATGQRERGAYPIPSDGQVSLRNDHLQYAITWFSLAIIGVVMFGFYYREKKHG